MRIGSPSLFILVSLSDRHWHSRFDHTVGLGGSSWPDTFQMFDIGTEHADSLSNARQDGNYPYGKLPTACTIAQARSACLFFIPL